LRPPVHIVERFIDNTFPRVVLQRHRCSANMLFFCSSFNLSILIPWFEQEICIYILFLGMTVLYKKWVQIWILVGFSLSLCLMTVYPYPEDIKINLFLHLLTRLISRRRWKINLLAVLYPCTGCLKTTSKHTERLQSSIWGRLCFGQVISWDQRNILSRLLSKVMERLK
jgi:hypothetical protein